MITRCNVSLFFFILLATTAVGQHKPLTMVKGFGAVRFEYDTLTVSARQVSQLLRLEPDAYEAFRRARSNQTVAGIVGAAGGVVLGFAAINSLLTSQMDWRAASVGAGLVLLSVPFERRFRQRATRALDLYNRNASARLVPVWQIGSHGVGVTIRF